ncbi:MAG TPA: YIP1 family protein [Methanosarcinaceae archaeon]|nr:YIP1 family protein [Methanosarcinaceae archaeon]
MLEILTNPDSFFEKKMNEEISFKVPLIIIFVVGVIGAVNTMSMMQAIFAELSSDAAQFASYGSIFAAVVAIISVFIMWVMYALVFYAISLALKGQGELKRVLEFVGYGFIPSIASSIIGLVVMRTVLPTIEFSIENPELMQQSMLSNPIIQASTIIGVIFTIWSANIWIFGLMHSRNLSTKNAIITVGIPIGLYIIYTLYSVFG